MIRRVSQVAILVLAAAAPVAHGANTDLRVLRSKLQRVATPTDSIIISLGPNAVVPPSGSTATGTAILFLNTVANTLSFNITHNVAGETLAHIHGYVGPGTNGAVRFTLPPGSPKIGTWNFLEADEASIREELAYIDIHSVSFPGGAIRGQIETCVDKPPVQGVQTCLHVMVQNLGPDPYDGAGTFDKTRLLFPALVAGKLKITVDIDEPTKPGRPTIQNAVSLADSFPVDIAPGDSVDLDFGPVDYFPPRPGQHEVTSTSGASGSNIDSNPANDSALSFVVVLQSTPAAGVGALLVLGGLVAAAARTGLRRRRAGREDAPGSGRTAG